MKAKTKRSLLQTTLTNACKGTSVTSRELLRELTAQDLVDIKNGDLIAADLKNIVIDLADNKDNAMLYRVNVKDNNTDPYSEGLF